MLLYYIEKNMIIHLPEQNNVSYSLDPNINIERIVYLEQTEFEHNKKSAQKWKGFGIY